MVCGESRLLPFLGRLHSLRSGEHGGQFRRQPHGIRRVAAPMERPGISCSCRGCHSRLPLSASAGRCPFRAASRQSLSRRRFLRGQPDNTHISTHPTNGKTAFSRVRGLRPSGSIISAIIPTEATVCVQRAAVLLHPLGRGRRGDPALLSGSHGDAAERDFRIPQSLRLSG